MPNDPAIIGTIKSAIAALLLEVEDINDVKLTEPAKATTFPMVSLLFVGFTRAGLESPEVDGVRVYDPLGGRSWIWSFKVRLWIDPKADWDAAQLKADVLVPALVRAWEEDKSLGGVADDSAVQSGIIARATPQNSSAGLKDLLLCEFDAVVETTEEV